MDQKGKLIKKHIDADALMKELESKRLVFGMNVTVAEALKKQGDVIRETIENAPAADVVEVVRCGDCEYFTEGMAVGMCKRVEDKPIIPIPFDHFCSFGRRREESKDQEKTPFNDLYNAFVERSKR